MARTFLAKDTLSKDRLTDYIDIYISLAEMILTDISLQMKTLLKERPQGSAVTDPLWTAQCIMHAAYYAACIMHCAVHSSHPTLQTAHRHYKTRFFTLSKPYFKKKWRKKMHKKYLESHIKGAKTCKNYKNAWVFQFWCTHLKILRKLSKILHGGTIVWPWHLQTLSLNIAYCTLQPPPHSPPPNLLN